MQENTKEEEKEIKENAQRKIEEHFFAFCFLLFAFCISLFALNEREHLSTLGLNLEALFRRNYLTLWVVGSKPNIPTSLYILQSSYISLNSLDDIVQM